jgi:hypothetical protein
LRPAGQWQNRLFPPYYRNDTDNLDETGFILFTATPSFICNLRKSVDAENKF